MSIQGMSMSSSRRQGIGHTLFLAGYPRIAGVLTLALTVVMLALKDDVQ